MGDIVELKQGAVRGPDGISPALRAALNDLIRRIVDLNGVTERHFLAIGSKVQEFSVRAGEITTTARSASEIMAGDEIRGAIGGLEEMVGQLAQIFDLVDKTSTRNLGSLRDIARSVRAVEKELIGLENTASDLKMLALSTKIQSTRTGSGSSAFMQLGQDIARMSSIISSKAEELFSQTTALSHFTHDVQQTLYRLKDKQKFQTENVLRGTRSIIHSMAELSEKSGSEAERIRLNSADITASVSEVVTSVQYQDIASQALSKVLKNLELILDRERKEVPPVYRAEAITPEILITGQCLGEARRLEEIDGSIQEALRKMVRSLEGIAGNIGKMAAVTAAATRDSTSFLSDLEEAMGTVTSFLKEVVQSSREMSESINSLTNTVEGMSVFTEDIEMISSEVELISLNARIMAVQTGVDGSGMGVIAEAVQETARDSEKQRRSVVEMLDHISRASLDLRQEIENAAKGEEFKLDQLVRELGVFLDALRIMQQRIVSMLSEIDSQSGDLNNAIRASVKRMREQMRQERSSADIARDMRTLALNSSVSIKAADLVLMSSGKVREEDLLEMGHRRAAELVDAFFRENAVEPGPEGILADTAGKDDSVLFDDDI